MIKPIAPVCQIYSKQNKKYAIAEKREALSQLLFDALTPFVAAYENGCNPKRDEGLGDDENRLLVVKMGDVRRAQAVLRLIATDIYA